MNCVWTAEQAQEWYSKVSWQVGFNFLPSTAVNTIEMWQKATFDEATIRRELSWAKDFGYNSVRVFLQYVVWEAERETFLETFETFLTIAAENDMTVLPILFDDCIFDREHEPNYGEQLPPIPGVHNSRWLPSPGFSNADDLYKQPLLQEYVHAVVGAHREDSRILAWDLYNEPGNGRRGNLTIPLLSQAFRWARECDPTQPLTAAPWAPGRYDSTFHAMMELSDVISFHSYGQLSETEEKWVKVLEKYGRPIFITEWLCRHRNNCFETHLPYFAQKKISCWNWGLVVGKTQTNLWWNSTEEPTVWQHDVMYPDGSIYCRKEAELLKTLRAADIEA